MKLRTLISSGMGIILLTAFSFSLIIPAVLVLFIRSKKHEKLFKVILLVLYLFCVFYLTLLDRQSGENGRIIFEPFWTYQFFSYAQYRWQIYLNIILFLPLGFLLPWSFKTSFMHAVLTGFLLSVFLEMIQYFFKLGLCEVDDVIHNTIGTVTGYGYWKALDHFNQIHGDKFRVSIIDRWIKIKNWCSMMFKEK